MQKCMHAHCTCFLLNVPVAGFFLHLCRYYSLEVSYFKSSLDRKLLEMLWNKYWVNTLSSSSLLTVSNKSQISLFIPFLRNYSQSEFRKVVVNQIVLHPLCWRRRGIKQLCNPLTRYTCNLEYPACHLYFLGRHTRPQVHVYTKKIHLKALTKSIA